MSLAPKGFKIFIPTNNYILKHINIYTINPYKAMKRLTIEQIRESIDRGSDDSASDDDDSLELRY